MKKHFVRAAIMAVIASFLIVSAALAWSNPTVTPLCAPDSTHFDFKVHLPHESNYVMEWSWHSDFSGHTSITLQEGDNTVTIPRGSHVNGDTWYIRFHDDHNAKGSANANGTLCHVECAVENQVAQTKVYGATTDVPPAFGFGPWTDNGNGTFSRTGTMNTTTPWTQEYKDNVTDKVCKTVQGSDPGTRPYTETETATYQYIPSADCKGWSVTRNTLIGQDIVKTEQNFQTGKWLNPFVLENVTTFAGIIYEPEICTITHQVTYGSDNTCEGWDAWYSIDGGSQVIYASGSWTQPFALESANVPAEDIPVISGQSYDNPHKDGFTVNESADCLRHQSSLAIVDGKCQFGQGTQKTFLVGEGLTAHITGDAFLQDVPAGSTVITFPNGHFSWTLTAAQGYDIVGPTSGDFWTDDFTCRPIPVCAVCGPRVEEIAKAPYDLVTVDYSRGPCTICLKTWTAKAEEYWRYARSVNPFSIQVFVPESKLIAAGIKYRTVPYPNHPGYKPMLFIDAVPFVGLDKVTYYILDLNKAVVGTAWAYYDTPSGKPYTEVWGWNSLTRSAYVDCSRTVGPWDISATGIASRLYGNPTSSDWVKFLVDSGYDANKAYLWSLQLWASQDGTLALPSDFVFLP